MSSLAWGLPFALAFQVLRSFSTALSRAVPPLIVMALAVLFNALGDYALIFGHFGLPRLGLFGAGMASASSNFFSFVAMLAFCLLAPELRDYRILHRLTRPDWKHPGRTVPSGPAHGRDHGVRGGAVQRRDLGDGRFRHRLASRRTRSPSPFPRSPSWCRWASGWRPRCGWAWRRARATPGGAARRLHRHRHGAGFHVRAPRCCCCCFRAPSPACGCRTSPANADVLALAVTLPACRRRLPDGGRHAGDGGDGLRGLKDARVPMWLAGASYWLAGAPMCALLGFGLGHARAWASGWAWPSACWWRRCCSPRAFRPAVTSAA